MARFAAFQKKQPGQLRADRAAHIVPMGTFALDAPCWKSALRAAFGHVLLLLLARGVIETLRDPRIVKAEIASQGRRQAPQIVRRERRFKPSSAQMPGVFTLPLTFVPRSAVAMILRFIG
jgi:hypothetical protein